MRNLDGLYWKNLTDEEKRQMKPMFDRYIKRFNDLSPLIKEDFPAGYGSYMIVKDSDGEYYLQFVE